MTTMDQEPARTLGNLEGRIVEQSKAIENLQQEMLENSRRLDAGLAEFGRHLDTELAELSRHLDTGLAELSRRLDAGLQEVRAGQRQIVVTNWIIGGGVIIALIGALLASTIGGG